MAMDIKQIGENPDVIICIPRLVAGGAERQALELARDLQDRGTRVGVVILRPGQGRNVRRLSTDSRYASIRVWNWLACLVSVHHQTDPYYAHQTDKERCSHTGNPGRQFCDEKPLSSWFDWPTLTIAERVGSEVPTADTDQSPSTLTTRVLLSLRLLLRLPHILAYHVFLELATLRLRPKLVIAFTPNANLAATLSSRPRNHKVVISERNDFSRMKVSRLLRAAQLRLYSNADVLTANTEVVVEDLAQQFPQTPVRWLPNGTKYRRRESREVRTGDNACIVARLEPQKRIEDIVKIFAAKELSKSHNISLHIFGAGSGARGLSNLVSALDLSNWVFLHGETPFDHIPLVELGIGFLISNSRHEGSSNSIHEGVNEGLFPLISSDVREASRILRPSLHSNVIFSDPPHLSRILLNAKETPTVRGLIFRAVQADFQQYWSEGEDTRRAALCRMESGRL